MGPNQGGAFYQPAQWAAAVPGGGASFGRGLRQAGLAHDCGVPSFEAFERQIQPGCACGGNYQQAAAMRDITVHIDADMTLTPDNRQLACDMLVHFAKYSNTTCRGCGLGWGIYFIICAIMLSILLGVVGAVVPAVVVASVYLLIGLSFILCWLVIYCNELSSESKLREREEAALARARGNV
jgi:hypothetical protein